MREADVASVGYTSNQTPAHGGRDTRRRKARGWGNEQIMLGVETHAAQCNRSHARGSVGRHTTCLGELPGMGEKRHDGVRRGRS